MPDFISIQDASFFYPPVSEVEQPVLSHIHLTITPGEFIALIGANGSGKSTLAKLLNALLLPTSGEVLIAGLDTRDHGNHARIRTQIGMIFQKPQDQIVGATVEEDIAFGPSNLGLEPSIIRQRVETALEISGLVELRNRPSYLLSAGETQRLALAGVLAMRPHCIIFDETTAMLDPSGRETVLHQIKQLVKQGITVILISHLMQEAAQADRVIVLDQHRIALDAPPEKVFYEEGLLKSCGLGPPPAVSAAKSFSNIFPAFPRSILSEHDLLSSLPNYNGVSRPTIRQQKFSRPAPPPSIRIENLSYTYLRDSPLAYQALDRLSLSFEEGCMHALIGSTGAGKTTIMQHLNGLIRPQSGSVCVNGFDLSDHNLDVRSLRRHVALAFQQPEDQIFEQYVGDEIAYAPRQLGYKGKLSDIVENAMQAVGLDFKHYKDRLTSALSSGEKRKVALASILSIQAEFLLLDEPLSGLDPRSSQMFIQLLNNMQNSTRTIVISTHQYDDLLPSLDTISLISRGRNVAQGSCASIFNKPNLLKDAGLIAPLSIRIIEKLRSQGWPIPNTIVSFQQLEEQLKVILGPNNHEPI